VSPATGQPAAAYDVVVVGGGTAGLTAAQVCVAAHRRVLLVEADRLGGECTWNGCVPSKTFIEAARLCHDMRVAAGLGIAKQVPALDFAAVMAHVRDTVRTIARYEDTERLEASGISVRHGRARMIDGHTLDIDGDRIRAERIVICTGSRPSVPPIDGLREVPFLTNETLFDLGIQPRRLLVLGAGPIGLEMAQAFARLGSEVVAVDVLPTLLPREDAEIAALARSILEAEGVEFRLGAAVERVEHVGNEYRLHIAESGRTSVVTGDALLVATGRRPSIDGLELETAGVRVTRAGIQVDARLRTTVASVFAAGDVTGILPFTHAAAYQGRIAGTNAVGKRATADYRVAPWVIFTQPEIGHVGLTEAEARAAHADVRTARLPFSAVDRAVIQGEPVGLIKVITGRKALLRHAGGGEVLGAHIVGPGAGELIHEFALAMQTRAFAGRIAQTIHAYPTLSLGVQQAVAQLFPAGRATAGDLRTDLAPAYFPAEPAP
jgi:pyruvate/2-oxoglutarate dehydrogenase complex dihydrolipoamide dehydrogenase (E3) component